MDIKKLFKINAFKSLFSSFLINNNLMNTEIFKEEIDKESKSVINLYKDLKGIFPTLNKEEIEALLYMLCDLRQEALPEPTFKIVATASGETTSFARDTVVVMRELINSAEERILITGFAISKYFRSILDSLGQKAKLGVRIEFYIDINDIVLEMLEEIQDLSLKYENILIYRYKCTASNMHAKVILMDDKRALVTSANLSYNGLINNVEVGVLLQGADVAQIRLFFEELKDRNLFTLYTKKKKRENE
ncbi:MULTISPECIES: phospholipase D-like domain-containing protein [Saccharibacillus]|uniref:phospholipase D-like domain-containing protein n=1 Tax=Saccharibacillus TaxID=456492 RepID=UPI001239C0CC|nr:phospholipase D-like domain-containing protein [Saccharibacillus sp. WB 17]MWJ30918.1 hypothetical protein [Saccharibacillus sp. WB 17]